MSEENTKLAGLDFAEGIPNADLPDGCMILRQVGGEAVMLARSGGVTTARWPRGCSAPTTGSKQTLYYRLSDYPFAPRAVVYDPLAAGSRPQQPERLHEQIRE